MNLYRLIAINGYAAYRNTLVGNPTPAVAEEGKRTQNPVPGDLVLEVSSLWKWARSPGDVFPSESLGMLLRQTNEPIISFDEFTRMHSQEEYFSHSDETYEDIPKEDVWYIEPLDPTAERVCRWTNCSFIRVHAEISR